MTQYVCHGVSTPGSLVQLADEPPGENCPTSGVEATVPLDHGDNTFTVTHSHDGVDTVYTVHMRRGGQFESLVFSTPGVN